MAKLWQMLGSGKIGPPGLGPLRIGVAMACVALLVAGCAETQLAIHAAKQIRRVPPAATAQPQYPSAQPQYKIGDPYRIDGVYYYPAVDYGYVETGIASWYGSKFHGRKTANGEIFDMNTLTAAHRTLPLPSLVRIANLDNGRSLVLRVNDRGPFARGRIIDVSRRAAQLLGFRYRGTARVRVSVLADESRRMAMLAQSGTLSEAERIAPPPTPTAVVVAQALPPPGQAPILPAMLPLPPPRNGSEVAAAAPLPPPTLEVSTMPVAPTALYVQAGAFVSYANAVRVRAKLARFGRARVVETRLGAQTFFRVRLGPLQDLERADRTLELVSSSGYPRARLVVDRPGDRERWPQS